MNRKEDTLSHQGPAQHSRSRLRPTDADLFDSSTLFGQIGAQLCAADCLPHKELHESWAFARRALRRLKGGRVFDLAGGHGLVGWLMAIQDRTTTEVFVVDQQLPSSAHRLHEALAERWPGLGARIHRIEGDLGACTVSSEDRVVAVHACGALTDRVLDLAIGAGASVGVMPCCHAKAKTDAGGLTGWLDHAVAVDVVRAQRLREAGYRAWTAVIDPAITPMNRVLLGCKEA